MVTINYWAINFIEINQNASINESNEHNTYIENIRLGASDTVGDNSLGRIHNDEGIGRKHEYEGKGITSWDNT